MTSTETSVPKPILGFVARLYGPAAPYSYAFLRFCTGAILVPHGVQKLFYGGAATLAGKTLMGWGLPAPLAWAYGLGILECVGGVMLALGLLTRPVALLFVIELLFIFFGVTLDKGWLWTRGGSQYVVFLLGLCVAVLLRGGGQYSIDRRIGKEF